MTQLVLELPNLYYQQLAKEANRAGRTIQLFVLEWISHLSEMDESFDIGQDPLYTFEGFESNAPTDLSIHTDNYLYGENAR